jgi:hypothetical protein
MMALILGTLVSVHPGCMDCRCTHAFFEISHGIKSNSNISGKREDHSHFEIVRSPNKSQA